MVRRTNDRNRHSRILDFDLDGRDLTGWKRDLISWSIGPSGSGASIEVDADLKGAQLAIIDCQCNRRDKRQQSDHLVGCLERLADSAR